MSNTPQDGGGPAGRNGITLPVDLRDWFAGQALAGLLANPDYDNTPDVDARYAYEEADAMIAHREQGAQEQ